MYNGIVKEENPYERLTKRKRLMDLFKKKAPATAEEKANNAVHIQRDGGRTR